MFRDCMWTIRTGRVPHPTGGQRPGGAEARSVARASAPGAKAAWRCVGAGQRNSLQGPVSSYKFGNEKKKKIRNLSQIKPDLTQFENIFVIEYGGAICGCEGIMRDLLQKL